MLSNLRQMENFKLETSDAKIVGMCGYFPQFLHGCSPPHSFGLEKILFSWNLNIPSVLLPCNHLERPWYSRIRIHFPLKKICTLRYSQPRRCMFACFCFACFSLCLILLAVVSLFLVFYARNRSAWYPELSRCQFVIETAYATRLLHKFR